MMQIEKDTTINVRSACNAAAAVMDVNRRSADAARTHQDFFKDPEHQYRVAQVQRIVSKFFTVRKGMYINFRPGRGQPFTVVKVDNPDFPRLNSKQIDTQYREPLRELGVEIVFSKQTNSYLFRIR